MLLASVLLLKTVIKHMIITMNDTIISFVSSSWFCDNHDNTICLLEHQLMSISGMIISLGIYDCHSISYRLLHLFYNSTKHHFQYQCYLYMYHSHLKQRLGSRLALLLPINSGKIPFLIKDCASDKAPVTCNKNVIYSHPLYK